MRQWSRTFVLLQYTVLAMLVPAVRGNAQTVSTATIAGTVKDSDGGVLPGVTVEVASPALIEKVRTVVTDGQGQYKVVDLRPAKYSVTFTLPGFNVVRKEDIDISAGFTATINADLSPAGITQELVVTAANPVVDVQNVSTQSVLTRERLNALPATQSVLGISQVTLGMIPTASGSTGLAADVGGNKGEQISSMAVHGGNQSDQISMIDGLSMQHTLNTGSGFFRLFFFNQNMAQEINVVSRGGSGEVQTAGVQVNMISKSGSNSWRVEGQLAGTNHHFNATNLDDALIARGVATPPSIDQIYDAGVGIGGPLLKDKIWVYGSTRAWGASEIITANYYNATQGTFTYTPDLNHPADRPSPNRDISANFTFQVSEKNRFTLFPMYQQNCNCRRGVNNSPATAPEGSEMGRFKPLFNLATTYSRTQSQRLLFQAGFMYVDTHAHYAPAPEVQFGDVRVTEQSSGLAYNSRVDTALNRFHDPQGNGYVSASYVTGSHALKAGFSFLRGYLEQNADFTSVLPIAYTVRKANANAPPSPVSITEYALPAHNHNDITTMGLYLQDQWTIRRMTLNLGIRYDYLHAWVPAQTRPAGYFTQEYHFDKVDNVPNWKDINPRFGFAYDLFGNGRTAVKASFGRYVEAESLTIASASNPSNAIVTNTTRTWSDPSFNATSRTADYTPPCDLLNPAANGGCGPISANTFGTPIIGTTYAPDVLVGWNIRPAILQASASITHELRPGLGVTVGYYRTSYQNIRVTRNTAVPQDAYDPYCVPLADDSRLPGGGGEQLCGFYDIQPAYFGQTRNVVTQASNFGNATHVYNGFDVNVNTRIRNGIAFVGGFSDGQTVTNDCFIVNSPQELRHCEVTQPWAGNLQFKGTVIYPLPFWDLRASAVYQNLAGVPILATNYAVSNATIAPSLGRNLASCGRAATCNAAATLTDIVEPYSEFEERLQQFDLRFSKIFRIAGGSVTGNFDIYNLFNANTILNRNNVYTPTGTTYGRPTDVLAGRLFKFAVQFAF